MGYKGGDSFYPCLLLVKFTVPISETSSTRVSSRRCLYVDPDSPNHIVCSDSEWLLDILGQRESYRT